jgi:hypothetical protein
MVEALTNHTPEIIVVDEITNLQVSDFMRLSPVAHLTGGRCVPDDCLAWSGSRSHGARIIQVIFFRSCFGFGFGFGSLYIYIYILVWDRLVSVSDSVWC